MTRPTTTTPSHTQILPVSANLDDLTKEASDFLRTVIVENWVHFRAIHLRQLMNHQYWSCVQAKRIIRVIERKYGPMPTNRYDVITAMLDEYLLIRKHNGKHS